MVAFNEVPSNLRTPFVSVEIDPSQASQGPALLAYRALLIGQILAAGTAVADTLYKVTSAEQVATLAGRGSMLHRQAIRWFAKNTQTETWIGTLDDNGAGAAATKTITVTGPATADGTIALYLGGERITIAVTSGDADTDIATAIDAAITAAVNLPVTSGVASAVVTTTARNAGEVGETYDIRHSYRDDEALPAGVGIAIADGTTGATNPVLTTLIAALGDTWFQIITHPYTDATSLTALEAELADRFGPMRMIDGVAVTAAAGAHATLTTLGDGRNSPHSVIMSQPGASPLVPPGEFAAECAAVVAIAAAADPARPMQTLGLNSLAPAEADLWTQSERNLLLFDGIGTSRVVAGAVQLGRVITTYQTNAAGGADTAYLDVTTMLTLMYLRYSFRQRMLSKYPRHKLADDGTRVGPGQFIMTRSLGEAEALGWFRDMERLGLVEGYDQFAADLVVERNVTDPNRLDFLLPPDLINQLIVTAGRIAFRL